MSIPTGLPVSHVGAEVAGVVIITGSPTVFVGSTAIGLADRCPTCKPTVGGPVNPILGAKLLPAETDFALPAPSPFAFSRGYLSRDARIGSLGQGWSLPGEGLGLEVGEAGTVLIDAQGRRIAFPALLPGGAFYSGSELLWIRRGGPAPDPQAQPPQAFTPWTGRWAAVPAAVQQHEGSVLVLAGQGFLHFVRGADGVWRLQAAFERNGYRTEFAWGEAGVLSSVRDSAGRSYVLVYRQLLTATDSDTGLRLLGVILAHPCGPVPADFDPAAPGCDWLVRYDFTAQGDLAAVRNRAGAVVRTFAWTQHMLVGHGQPDGLQLRYAWDQHTPAGKVLRQVEVDGLSREYRYHPDHTEVLDSLGRVERYEFAGEGGLQRWTAHVRADGSRIEYEYDLFGRLVAVKDPLGRVTRHCLDGKGRLREVISPGQARQRYRLDDETGLVTEVRDAAGREWHIRHDARGNLLSRRGPDGEHRYVYADPQLPDRPTQVIDPKGGVKQLSWNRLGQLLSHTDCSGQTSSHEYDAEGRRSRSRDALGQSTQFSYDRLGQLTEVRLADGARVQYHYDALGRQTRIDGPEGRSTQLGWDRFGRLLSLTDPAGLRQAYQYDAAGRLVALSNENQAQTRFAYDALDRLTAETGFDGRSQRYAYTAAGELSETTEADGLVTAFDYDRDGRLLARHLPATAQVPAQSEYYQWHPDGRLASLATASSQVLFAYDDAGRLCLETQAHLDGWTYSVAHQHDALGVRQSSQYGDAPPVTWLTYGSGHLHGVLVEGLELAFERDALHREIHRDARRTGETETLFGSARTYDSQGRLSASALTPAVGPHWQRHYQYDPLGQLTGIADTLSPSIAYQYDRSGRLVASRHGEAPAQRYRFDPAGNRLGQPDQPQAPEQDWAQQVHANLDNPAFDLLGEGRGLPQGPRSCWPSNRIDEQDGSRYLYDAAGNLIERQAADGSVLRLGYDGANRLTLLHHQHADGRHTEARYHYDGLSRRIAKAVSESGIESITHYGWDGDRQCSESTDTQLRTTVYEPGSFVPLLRLEQQQGPDAPVLAQLRRQLAGQGQALPAEQRPASHGRRVACFHTDHLGTPLKLSDNQGQTLWQAEPDDWAAVNHEQGSSDQPIRFQGQYHDEESGLYYNRYRYYEPGLGRYVTQDPIGLKSGEPNFYNYPKNPVRGVDPLGLEPADPVLDPVIKGYSFFDKVSSFFDLITAYEEGEEARVKNKELSCKAEEEQRRRVAEGYDPYSAKLAEGAQKISDGMAGPVSDIAESWGLASLSYFVGYVTTFPICYITKDNEVGAIK